MRDTEKGDRSVRSVAFNLFTPTASSSRFVARAIVSLAMTGVEALITNNGVRVVLAIYPDRQKRVGTSTKKDAKRHSRDFQ